jgi:hypothetical protein
LSVTIRGIVAIDIGRTSEFAIELKTSPCEDRVSCLLCAQRQFRVILDP